MSILYGDWRCNEWIRRKLQLLNQLRIQRLCFGFRHMIGSWLLALFMGLRFHKTSIVRVSLSLSVCPVPPLPPSVPIPLLSFVFISYHFFSRHICLLLRQTDAYETTISRLVECHRILHTVSNQSYGQRLG